MSDPAECHEMLLAFSRTLGAESHTIRHRPALLWQQLHNGLAPPNAPGTTRAARIEHDLAVNGGAESAIRQPRSRITPSSSAFATRTAHAYQAAEVSIARKRCSSGAASLNRMSSM